MSQSEGFETRCTDAPVCPHCGAKQTDAWEMNFGEGIEGEGTFDCDECSEDYHAERVVAISYNTEKIKGKK